MLKGAFPELENRVSFVMDVLKDEEMAFNRTLDKVSMLFALHYDYYAISLHDTTLVCYCTVIPGCIISLHNHSKGARALRYLKPIKLQTCKLIAMILCYTLLAAAAGLERVQQEGC
jgi:hypothetical protein